MLLSSDYRELADTGLDRRRIEAFWCSTASADGDYRVLPDGRMDLIVRFRTDARLRIEGRRLLITGPARRHADVPVRHGDRFFGARFRPGWGGLCLGTDPLALAGNALVGDEVVQVLGADAAPLLQAPDADALREALVETVRLRALRARSAAPGIDAAIERMHLGGGQLALPDLVASAGMSERSLRRHLRDRVGLTYSAFVAVLRFQRAMRRLAVAPVPTLAQVAVECGYSDQAHMTREFIRHGGFTPGQRLPVTLVGMPLDGVAAIFNTA